MPSFFITGTDTGVGKTWFTCWLVRVWRAQGHNAIGLKPISTGDRQDAMLLREASGNILTLDEINPLYFREPATPLVAAREENREIDFAEQNRAIHALCSRFSHCAVEGVGGWRVPLAPDYEVRDWARDLALPVVVVARAGLGTLNHTLLTVESIQRAGLTCEGIVLNPGPKENGNSASPNLDLVQRTNRALLESILLLPVFNLDGLAQAAGKIPVWLGGKEI